MKRQKSLSEALIVSLINKVLHFVSLPVWRRVKTFVEVSELFSPAALKLVNVRKILSS
jgi:hypothetical protein